MDVGIDWFIQTWPGIVAVLTTTAALVGALWKWGKAIVRWLGQVTRETTHINKVHESLNAHDRRLAEQDQKLSTLTAEYKKQAEQIAYVRGLVDGQNRALH
jgi:hypothetical protein